MEVFILAAVVCFAFLVVLFKLGIRKALGFDVLIDIAVSGILMVCFMGTFAGMAAAIVAGALFSVVLLCIKWIAGYERLRFHKWRPSWEAVDPVWRKVANDNFFERTTYEQR